nr:transcription factor SPT20 homolog [Halyomorpha halys]
MKLLLITLYAVGCALGEAPYPAAGNRPQGALLEYGAPVQPGSTFQSTETEDLAKLTNNLRQEVGSGAGSYHVFLNDGRLQKVQYTTASLRNGQQWNSGIQQYSDQYNQVSQVENNGLNHNGESSRLQQDYLPPQLNGLNQQYYNQQNNGNFQQFSQQQQNGQYLQQQSQLAQEYGLPETQLGRIQDELQERQIQQLEQRQQQLEQQQQELRQQQEELRSASYLASLRYNNVDPITSPVYSYKPPTRVLRYAPEY